MKILFLASEVAPFSKTGGLADVAGALPQALAGLGHDVVVATPLYGSVKREGLERIPEELTLRFPFGPQRAELYERRIAPNCRVLFIGHDGYFDRPGIYGEAGGDYPDNHRRFAFFSMAAMSAAQLLAFDADIVHLNDWQTGLAAVALERGYRGTSLGRASAVFTIHNLAYQGVFPKAVMNELGLPWDLFVAGGLEFYDQVNFLKAGLSHSHALTTVSPSYAREVQTPDGGWGLDGLLRDRSADLHGIVNGVDSSEWNPAMDPHLPATFNVDDLRGKATCREALLQRYGLPPTDGPVFGIVSRMVMQKGFDILLPALPRLLEERELRLVVLGTGDPRYELILQELAQRYPAKVSVNVGYDAGLSHLIEAGSDFFLMPSQYEPCGLNQMYSLLYGTVPIVRAVGGLNDTVRDLSEPGGNGIKFDVYGSQAVLEAIERAFDLFADAQRLREVQRAGMLSDFSWRRSAQAYEAVFRTLVDRRKAQ